MESSRSLQHLAEYDSFFFGWLDDSARHSPPYLDRLVHSVGHSFRISTSSAFIDLYPQDDLFSADDFTTAASDFDLDLPVVDDAAPSTPMLQVSPPGRLLPCEPGGGSGAQEDGDESVITSRYHTEDAPSAPWLSAFSSPDVSHKARSTACSLGACSSATSKHAWSRSTLCVGKRRAASSPGKVMRFAMPLYRKVIRAMARRHGRFPSPASPARGATSRVGYHGSADTDVYDAILYCKKSSGSRVQETNRM
ncbi:hypothetical protein D1007_44181 [Hordeum vulgare]|uniref:Membrane-associated kinase regulator 6 n=1 Tax=Hordeum vulgare subsp. vulgare TaxID=112509 RepID=A0A8I7BDC1_HORVV|nr:hypothetical protein D1007_44181 [Hordeum vulgare]